MEFNKNQREGLAKVADNLATAILVADIVGGMIDQKIGFGASFVLLVLFFVLLFIGYRLRKGDHDGN